jgi:DNA modification methylase
MSDDRLTILCGDALEQLRTLPDESVQCCVTSPPYWGLRDYGTAKWEGGDSNCDHITGRAVRTITEASAKQSTNNGSWASETRDVCEKCGAKRIDSQLGLEKTPEQYVAKMVEVFREVRRVLRKDGTLWLNLGDSYASDAGKCRNPGGGENSIGKTRKDAGAHPLSRPNVTHLRAMNLKAKDLVGIPWMVAFALRADGWWLRSDIIWAKPNPMPESVTDRPTKSHEYLFLLTKAASYYYDAEAIQEPISESYAADLRPHGVLRQRFYPDSKYVKGGIDGAR